MKMKKIIAAGLAIALSMGSTVYASEVKDPTPEDNSKDITATYNDEAPEPKTVYSVDVAWGSLEYTYNSGITRTWDTNTLKFVESKGTPGWSCESGADTITVTNHSNAGITASFTYGETNDSSISGSFSQAAVVLGAAQENTERGAAPSGQTTLSLSGDLADTSASKKEIGQVTVEIGEESGSAHINVMYGNANGMDIVLHSGGNGIYTAEVATDKIIEELDNGIELQPPLKVKIAVTILGKTYYVGNTQNSLAGDLVTNSYYAPYFSISDGDYIFRIDINQMKWTLEKQ